MEEGVWRCTSEKGMVCVRQTSPSVLGKVSPLTLLWLTDLFQFRRDTWNVSSKFLVTCVWEDEI